MPLASRFTAVIRLYRQKSIFNKLSLHTQRRTCTFKIFSRSCTSNGRTMDTNTLKDIAPPDRLPTQRPSSAPCLFAAPKGVHAARRRAVSAAAPCASQRQPKSLPSFAPPLSTPKNMRPTQSNARQKTTTLRRSGSFGFGQQVSALRSVSVGLPAAQTKTLRPRRAALGWHLLPVPKALRPPLHLSKR